MWGGRAPRPFAGGGEGLQSCCMVGGGVEAPASPPAALPGAEVLRARQRDRLLPPTEPASAGLLSVIYNAIKS